MAGAASERRMVHALIPVQEAVATANEAVEPRGSKVEPVISEWVDVSVRHGLAAALAKVDQAAELIEPALGERRGLYSIELFYKRPWAGVGRNYGCSLFVGGSKRLLPIPITLVRRFSGTVPALAYHSHADE